MSGIKEEFLKQARQCGYTAMETAERYRFLSDFVMRHLHASVDRARTRAAEEKTA